MATSESDQITTYSSGSTYNVPDGIGLLYVDPASLIAALSILMPPNPADGQRFRAVYGGSIGSGTVVTLITFSANTGQGMIGITTVVGVAGNSALWQYRTSSGKWYRLQ